MSNPQSESRNDLYPEASANGSHTIFKDSLNRKATVRDTTDDKCSSKGTVNSPGHDEDLELPSNRVKTLITSWTYTSPDVSDYFNERMLELSRITRRTIAARMRYQRLRSHELELIKSITDDELEQSKTQLNAVDQQAPDDLQYPC
ncbi:hypothetical protein EDB19DRAFT_1828007 [Suillus lakei]|nr:hypothetical protein EDB19DRAFT_1828007 [Suillus lakei]